MLLYQKTSLQRPYTTRRKVSVCATKPSFDFKELIEKRKELDKKRIERIKEIGNTLDHIAKAEVKSTGETFNTYFPFLENLKNFKGIEKKDVDAFFKDLKEKHMPKKEENKKQE